MVMFYTRRKREKKTNFRGVKMTLHLNPAEKPIHHFHTWNMLHDEMKYLQHRQDDAKLYSSIYNRVFFNT